jgi:hypothetical protein
MSELTALLGTLEKVSFTAACLLAIVVLWRQHLRDVDALVRIAEASVKSSSVDAAAQHHPSD